MYLKYSISIIFDWPKDAMSIIDGLKKLQSHEANGGVVSTNYTTLEDHKVRHLLRNYNGIVVFKLLPIVHLIGNHTNVVTMGSMDTKLLVTLRKNQMLITYSDSSRRCRLSEKFVCGSFEVY